MLGTAGLAVVERILAVVVQTAAEVLAAVASAAVAVTAFAAAFAAAVGVVVVAEYAVVAAAPVLVAVAEFVLAAAAASEYEVVGAHQGNAGRRVSDQNRKRFVPVEGCKQPLSLLGILAAVAVNTHGLAAQVQ